MANGGIQQVDLVGPNRGPVVTPQATQQLSEAFRSGFITADDIVQRMSERTRAKQELELVTAKQGIAEATDPGLIQARQSQQLLAGEQAQQTRELLPLARRATEEKLFGDIRSGQVARYGLKEKLEALNNVGFAPAPENGITAAFATDVERRFNMMTGWQTKKGRAVLALANIDAGEIVGPSGATGRGPTDKQTGAPIPEGQVQQLRKDAAETFTEYLFGIPPGETATATTPGPVIQPTAAPVIQPIVTPATAIAPVAAAPTEFPPGFVQVKPAPVTAESTAGVKRTDALQRELVQLDAVQNSINQARRLAVPGIVGPGQIGVTRGMHQLFATLPFGLGAGQARIYTSQDQLNNVIADEIGEFVRDWKGAISDKELRFFQAARPRIDSTPERWTSYLDEWQVKNEKLKKIVAGELVPDEPAVWAANPKSSAGVLPAGAPQTLTSPAAPLPASPASLPVVSTMAQYNALPSGSVFQEPDGTPRKKH